MLHSRALSNFKKIVKGYMGVFEIIVFLRVSPMDFLPICPEEGNKACERAVSVVLSGAAEGFVWSKGG